VSCLLTFSEIKSIKRLFFHRFLSLSSKKTLNLKPQNSLNFSKAKRCMPAQEEQAETLSYFKLQSLFSHLNIKYSHLKKSLFLKKEVLFWKLMALYGLLSISIFFQSRRFSISFLLDFLLEEIKFRRQNSFKKVRFFLIK